MSPTFWYSLIVAIWLGGSVITYLVTALVTCRMIRKGSRPREILNSTGVEVTIASAVWPILLGMSLILIPVLMLSNWISTKSWGDGFNRWWQNNVAHLAERTIGKIFSKLVSHCVSSHERRV